MLTATRPLATAIVSAPIRRVLLVTPGGKWSTHDVFVGLHRGLRAIGVESFPFDTSTHLEEANEWVKLLRQMRGGGDFDSADEYMAASTWAVDEKAVIRALAVQADAVIVITGFLFCAPMTRLFHHAGMPVYLYCTESPYDDDIQQGMVPWYAVASTNDRASLPLFEAAAEAGGAGTRVLHLPLGYDPETHYPGSGSDCDLAPSHDVVFVGNVFPSRERFLREVDWRGQGIDLGLYGDFRTMPAGSPLWAYTPREATPDDPIRIVDNRITTALHGKAKIVLNFFREERFRGPIDDPETWRKPAATVTGAVSVNPRIIECAAAGAFVLSEWRADLDDPPWRGLIPTFRTPAEMAELVTYYLEHDAEREEIAGELPRAVEGWSYHDRAAQIVAALGEAKAAMG
jgi:spore maturation protein CgeB